MYETTEIYLGVSVNELLLKAIQRLEKIEKLPKSEQSQALWILNKDLDKFEELLNLMYTSS